MSNNVMKLLRERSQSPAATTAAGGRTAGVMELLQQRANGASYTVHRPSVDNTNKALEEARQKEAYEKQLAAAAPAIEAANRLQYSIPAEQQAAAGRQNMAMTGTERREIAANQEQIRQDINTLELWNNRGLTGTERREKAEEQERAAQKAAAEAELERNKGLTGSERLEPMRNLENQKKAIEAERADMYANPQNYIWTEPLTGTERRERGFDYTDRFDYGPEMAKRGAEYDRQIAEVDQQLAAITGSNYAQLQYMPDFQQYENAGAKKANKHRDTPDEGTHFGNRDAQIYDGSYTYWDLLTEEEQRIYNYILGKYGEESADIYWEYILPTAQNRYGMKVAQGIENSDWRAGAIALNSLGTGVTKWMGGMLGAAGAVAGYEVADSGLDYASAYIKDNMGRFGDTVYDLGVTVGNMLPSMMFGGTAGTASMGLSAGGNAYQQGRREGMTEGQALTYGALVGASEALLQKAMGGISRLGGASGAFDDALRGIENGFLRFVAVTGNSMRKEASEEALQAILEPIFQSIITGENVNVDWSEVAYSALMGALMGGVFEAPGNVAEAISSDRTDPAINNTLRRPTMEAQNLTQEGVSPKAGMDIPKTENADIPHPGAPRFEEDQGARATVENNMKQFADFDAYWKDLQKRKALAEHRERYAEGEAVHLAIEAVKAIEAEERAAVNMAAQQKPDSGNQGMPGMGDAKAAEMKASEERVQSAKAYTGYGENGAKAFNEVMVDYELDTQEARKKFQTAYEAGLTNLDKSKANLSNPIQVIAFEAGLKDYQAAVESGDLSVIHKNPGFLSINAPKGVTKREIQLVDKLARAFGARVAWADNLKGNAEIRNGIVYLSRDFDRVINKNTPNERKVSIVYHAAHEIGMHQLMKLAPKEGRAFINALYAEANAGRPESAGTLAMAKQRAYYEQEVEITTEEAMEEIAANEILRLYNYDEKAFAAALERIMTGKDETAKQGARTFRDILDSIIEAFKNFVSKLRGEEQAEAKAVLGNLEELRNLYENAMKAATDTVKSAEAKGPQNAKTAAQKSDGKTQYQLKQIGGKQIVWIENSALTNKQLTNHAAVAEYIAQHIGEVYTIIESGQRVYIGDDLPGEYTHSKYTDSLRKRNPALLKAKNKATSDLGLLIETASNRRWEKTRHTASKDAKYGMYRYDTSFAFPIKDRGGNVTNVRAYDAELLIRNASDGKKYLYDIVNIKENTASAIDLQRRETRLAAHKAASRGSASEENVAQKQGTVKTQHSLKEIDSLVKAGKPISAQDEVKYSLKFDDDFMEKATKVNDRFGRVSPTVMKRAAEMRRAIADIFNDPDLADSLGLPPDIIGNTYIPNGSYSGTEENSTVCIRSIAADALMDAVAEHLGRPLTVEDTIIISQELMRFTDKPECLYCYVAMDRKAHREFLGSYLKQRDDVLENIKNGMSKEEAYQKFLDGRKDTKPMKDRFNMWLKNDGKDVITPADLASYANMEKAIERNPALKAQINDALKYAQSASWAKKRVAYSAYNGHILKWKYDRILKLNSNYGLRMYSFSDFSPAFILENMQMITDAAVRGLKVLAYTKELDFVKIFAKTGMNINISVFGYNDGKGGVAMDAMQGADWAEAQALRKQYKNVGCTFVATNDAQVNWALDQDWIDVIIPFHMVRTGSKVAEYFSWKNYTAMSADTKDTNWTKADAKHILPPKHQNNKAKYLKACEENHLVPRFKEWVEHPNYMKLVNETRRSEKETEPVQPIFDLEAAKVSIEDMRKRGGYYTPVGGSIENMRDIAEEIGDSINGKQYSLKEERDLLAENARLKEVNATLREQFKLTKVAKPDDKALKRFTRDILRDYSSEADAEDINKALGELYLKLTGKSPSWNETYEIAYNIATEVLENASVINDEMYQTYRELRHTIRTTGISISKEYDGDMEGYESLNDFRKANWGRINLVKDGIAVDSFYHNLADNYPEFFDEAEYSSPADQLNHIAKVLDSLTPKEYNPFQHDMREQATWLANDIMARVYEVEAAKPTFADKAKQREEEAFLLGQMAQGRVMAKQLRIARQHIEEAKARTKKLVEQEKAEKWSKVKEIKAEHRAKDAKKSESQKAKELRAKILRHIAPMKQKLLRPSDKQHVPQELREAVAAMLDAINLESGYDYVPGSQHLTSRGATAGKRTEKGAGDPTKRAEEFRNVRELYQKIIGEGKADEMVIDPALIGGEGNRSMLDEVIAMRDTPLASMSVEQLQTVWDCVRAIEHSISEAGKTFAKNKFATIKAFADAFVKDTASRKAINRDMAVDKRAKDLETPYTFFSRYGEAGMEFYRALRNAQDAEQIMQDELVELVGKIVSSEQKKKLEKDVQVFTTGSGDELTLSKAHVMEIYLLNKREQARGHLTAGGIVQPEAGKVKRGSEPVLLTEADVLNIIGSLTEEEQKIADGLQKLTLWLAEKGNEASMKVYGYEKFNDPNYWTIRSANEQIAQTVEKNRDNPRSIANMGSAKPLTPNASNALDISGVFDTFSRHASDMLTYSAWLATMEDANRLFNFKFKDDKGNITGKNMQTLLNKVGGAASTNYWLELMKDIQNGIQNPADTGIEGVAKKIVANTKKASVSANIRVVIQQPTAIARATAVLNPAYLTAALGKDVAVKPAIDGWNKAVKYAPIASRKAAGGYEVSSNPKQLADLIYKSNTKKGKVADGIKEAPLWLAGEADKVTWGTIWNACEMQVKAQNKGLEGEAFYAKVAELFTEVIDQTQVVDGVLQRSQAMRSGSALMQQMTSFTGEPTMAANMVIRAYDNVRREQDTEKRKAGRKKLARTLGAYILTAGLNAFAQSIIDAMRDDEDDDKFWRKIKKHMWGITGKEEKFMERVRNVVLAGNFVNNLNPLTWIPILKDVVSIVQGYGVERMDAASMSDAIDAYAQTVKSLGGNGKLTVGYAFTKALTATGKILGISVANIIRDVESVIDTIHFARDDIEGMYEVERLISTIPINKARYADLAYMAYIRGDMELHERIRQDMIAAGVDAGYIKTAMDNRMKDTYGIDDVKLLPQRYMTPEQQKSYDAVMDEVEKSSVWNKADARVRKNVSYDYYELVTGASAAEGMVAKMEAASKYGIDSVEFLLYEAALGMADKPNENGSYGTFTNDEYVEAINAVPGLSRSEKSNFWEEVLGKSEKTNPWG